jgi:hypothetical protein
MDLVPFSIDGALVFVLQTDKAPVEGNEKIISLTIQLHNWVKLVGLNYVVFDFSDLKEIENRFLIETMQLRKRIDVPFLFSGVSSLVCKVIGSYGYKEKYPFFVTPEDAIRALRIQNPGITECISLEDINFGVSICDPRSIKMSKYGNTTKNMLVSLYG